MCTTRFLQGVVKWFKKKRGVGFISVANGGESGAKEELLPVRSADIANGVVARSLVAGQRVTLTIGDNGEDGGPAAVNGAAALC